LAKEFFPNQDPVRKQIEDQPFRTIIGNQGSAGYFASKDVFQFELVSAFPRTTILHLNARPIEGVKWSQIPVQKTYSERMDRFIKQLVIQRLSAAVIYADREHFANLAYLTGFEPRFEEALAIIYSSGT